MSDQPSSSPPGPVPGPIGGLLEPLPAGASGDGRMSMPSLQRKAAGSVAWTFVRLGTDQVFNFVLFALLARWLGPEAFGVFALAFLYVELGKIVTSAGLMDALMREPELTNQTVDSVFWANMTLALVAATAGFLLAPAIGAFFGQPEVAPVIQVLAFLLPVSAAGTTHMTLRLREFGHRTVALRSIVSGVVGGGAALAAALAGWGIWSFVVQRAVFELVGMLLAWRAHPWIPGRDVSLTRLRALFAFSSNMLLTQLLTMLLIRIQDVIIGRTIGAAAVGAYRTAWKMTEVIAQGTLVPFSTVALPTLARLQHDPAGFDVAYRRLVAATAILALPAMTGFGLLAGDIIVVLFGPQWQASIPVAWVLSAMALPLTLEFLVTPALAALGRSATIAKIVVVKLAMTLVLSYVAAPYGLTAVAIAFALHIVVSAPLQLLALKRHGGVSIALTLRSMVPPVLATLAMSAVVLLAYDPLRARIDSVVPFLAVIIVLAGATYAASLVLVGGKPMRRQLMQLKSMMR